MSSVNEPADQPVANCISIPREGKLDYILARIDLAAFVITLLGIGLLGVVALATAVFELARLAAILWSNPLDRWGIIVVGVAIIWVIARWKKSCAS
jgi:hypothetical protein